MSSSDRLAILINPYYLFRSLWKHRQLIVELSRREISQQCQGSFFGFMWSILAPLSTLLIYTSVFSVVFKARWPGQVETSLGAVLIYYSTDYVFDGALGRPHVRKEYPNPLTLYGRSKFAGEENISVAGGDVSYPAHPLGLHSKNECM